MTEYHNGMKFTTKDQDNDLNLNQNCAISEHSGWWFDACSWTNLNGRYYTTSDCPNGDGITWYDFRGWTYSLKVAQMKIRPHLQ